MKILAIFVAFLENMNFNQTLVKSRIHEKTTKKYSLFFKERYKLFPVGLVLYNHDNLVSFLISKLSAVHFS